MAESRDDIVRRLQHDAWHRAKDDDSAGCAFAIGIVFFFAAVVFVALTMIRWTSIENGCVVEKKFDYGMTAHVIEKVCP